MTRPSSAGVALVAAAIVSFPAFRASAGTKLAVQFMVNDKSLSITEVIGIDDDEGSQGTWVFPLLLPESGPQPSFARRSESVPGGIEVGSGPGTKASFDGDRLTLTGDPAAPGGLRAQARYTVPVTSDSIDFSLSPEFDMDSLQFVTRRSATYGIQLRPLVPYSYREEVEEDGTWQYMSPIRGVPSGSVVRVAARHLPSPFHDYRLAGMVSISIAVGLVLVSIARRRDRGP